MDLPQPLCVAVGQLDLQSLADQSVGVMFGRTSFIAAIKKQGTTSWCEYNQLAVDRVFGESCVEEIMTVDEIRARALELPREERELLGIALLSSLETAANQAEVETA